MLQFIFSIIGLTKLANFDLVVVVLTEQQLRILLGSVYEQ